MSSAQLSECGRFRFRLDRKVRPTGVCPVLDEGSRVLFIGVNPSTADATFNDPTIRRMMGFAARWGFWNMTVANLFTFRSPSPQDLAGAYCGPWHDEYLERDYQWLKTLAGEAHMIVPCWGRIGKIPRYLRHQRDAALNVLKSCQGETLICHLGPLVGGTEPAHPLFLPYETELNQWHV